MLIIDDSCKCNICGAYWNSNGICSNGHFKSKVNDQFSLLSEDPEQ